MHAKTSLTFLHLLLELESGAATRCFLLLAQPRVVIVDSSLVFVFFFPAGRTSLLTLDLAPQCTLFL